MTHIKFKFTGTILILLLCIFCTTEEKEKRLNILWLVAEDLSADYINAYGDGTVSTPNIDRLAREGVVYTNNFSVSGVCAPSRSTLATGLYPNAFGAHNMRNLKMAPAASDLGLFDYQVVPPKEVKMVSEIMRERGYYCTNNAKEDYQFFKSELAWDESDRYAHWRNRPKEGMPFFSIFNFEVTHESVMWSNKKGKYERGKYPPNRNTNLPINSSKNYNNDLQFTRKLKVEVPPYLPQNDIGENAMRRMYHNIIRMDKAVGKILAQLEEDGLLDQTIIMWYTDHGGPFPRHKRLLYDSGLKVPLIIRYPDGSRAGEKDDRLISFVDYPPTLLSLAKIATPEFMQGHAFEGKYKSSKPRDFIHGQADRFDERQDMIRAVRNKRFKYLKNFQPEKPYYLAIAYRERMEVMQELLRMRDAGTLDKNQSLWFRQRKEVEELFDIENDPYELRNIAGDPAYAKVLEMMRSECERWMNAINDKGFIKELDLIEQFYPGGKPQFTAPAQIQINKQSLALSCPTPGARVGYRYSSEKAPYLGWNHYSEPLVLKPKDTLEIIAHRLGFKHVIIKVYEGEIIQTLYPLIKHELN